MVKMTPPVPPVPASSTIDVQDIVQKIFSSSNWRSEVEKTVRRNAKLLTRNKELQATVDKFGAKFNLETGEPKEGKLLSKDEAASYDAFVKLGKKPEELTAMVGEFATLKTKETERADEEKYADAADALGFENVPALTRWLKREKLVLEFKDQRVEDEETGKKVVQKLPFVRPAGDDKAALEPLDEYIEREVPEFIDIFRVKPAGDEDEGGSEGTDRSEEDDIISRAGREANERVRGGRGVRVPATRGADRSPPQARDKKKLEQMEQEARSSQHYSL
jgi:hypothetical protein